MRSLTLCQQIHVKSLNLFQVQVSVGILFKLFFQTTHFYAHVHATPVKSGLYKKFSEDCADLLQSQQIR